MKNLSISISAISVVVIFTFIVVICAVSEDSSNLDELVRSVGETFLLYQPQCQKELNSKLTLQDAFSGDLNDDKACLIECIMMKSGDDEKANAELYRKVIEKMEKSKEKCDQQGDCKDNDQIQNMAECIRKRERVPQPDICLTGEQFIKCAKIFYTEEIEVFLKEYINIS